MAKKGVKWVAAEKAVATLVAVAMTGVVTAEVVAVEIVAVVAGRADKAMVAADADKESLQSAVGSLQ